MARRTKGKTVTLTIGVTHLLTPNPFRVGIVISAPTAAGNFTVSLGDSTGENSGLRVFLNDPPLKIMKEEYGEDVTKSVSTIAAAALVISVCEIIESDGHTPTATKE